MYHHQKAAKANRKSILIAVKGRISNESEVSESDKSSDDKKKKKVKQAKEGKEKKKKNIGFDLKGGKSKV
ncbi:hypothetical protein DPMN_080809 [Dreissena polymorpha]|uniref:Uncharacterized protein n=1 Tax=Dreissena polymorpha TaxID=45954 RepID=A0A9D3YWC7_DREPO|nr:hypothetical protein DPMN_080809 [Dreissena polymorpha]